MDGRQLVLEHDWRAFVQQALTADTGPIVRHGWDATNTEWLQRHPEINAIIAGFLPYVQEHASGITYKRNATTGTISLPNLTAAGLYLRSGGIAIGATRKNEYRSVRITRPKAEQYERALDFLRALPTYS